MIKILKIIAHAQFISAKILFFASQWCLKTSRFRSTVDTQIKDIHSGCQIAISRRIMPASISSLLEFLFNLVKSRFYVPVRIIDIQL